jgi:hypothetical protein
MFIVTCKSFGLYNLCSHITGTKWAIRVVKTNVKKSCPYMNPECQLYITCHDKSGADIIDLNAWYTGCWIFRKVSITDFELVMNSKWGGNQYHDMIDMLRFLSRILRTHSTL